MNAPFKVSIDSVWYRGSGGMQIHEDGSATLSYAGPRNISAGALFTINGRPWKVTKVTASEYNKGFINVRVVPSV